MGARFEEELIGHAVESCFQSVGYPEWWGDCLRGSGHCIGHGHSTQQASHQGGVTPHGAGSGRGHGGGVRANVAAATPVANSVQGVIGDQGGFPRVSDEQWKWL